MRSFRLHLLAIAMATVAQAQAANIILQTKVANYSQAGWIRVVPELRNKLGGRVAFLAQYGGWVTDRVQRGEPLAVTVQPTTRAERSCRGSFIGVDASNGFFAFTKARLPYSRVQSVSRNPAFDDVYVWVISEAGYFETRIPIGSRPAR